MNLGMTLAIGAYGTGGAFFSELFMGPNEWNGALLAFKLVAWLTLLAFTCHFFERAYSRIDDDRE
jgi:hypothetical protein